MISRVIGDKRRWRAYKARCRQLPDGHRIAVEAIERYSMYFVPTDSDNAVSMFEDLVDQFEQAVADRTPVRAVLGDNSAEFVASFAESYTEGGYVPKRERKRLVKAVARAEREDESRS